MKRIIAALVGLALLFSLAACSSQGAKSISANKLTPQEKTALNFTENLYSSSKSKQYAAIDQFAAQTSISGLKKKITGGGFQQKFHAVGVIKGVEVKSKQSNEFVALLTMKDQRNTVNKRIVVMSGGKVLHILSGNSKLYVKELGN